MSNPTLVATPQSVWTKVATNVTSAGVMIMTQKANYYWTYRDTGAAAPTLNSECSVLLKPGRNFSNGSAFDLYIWCTVDAGVVRVDQGLDNELAGSGVITASTQSMRVEEIDPLSQHYVGETLADVTNGTDGTYYYYVDMAGFRKLGYQLILNGGSGTVTVTLEATAQDDGTAPGSCAYEDVTNDVLGVVSITASDYIADDAEVLAMTKYVRLKVVAATGGANDADWAIYSKRLY